MESKTYLRIGIFFLSITIYRYYDMKSQKNEFKIYKNY